MPKSIIIIGVILVFVIFFVSLFTSRSTSQATQQKPLVMTSFYPLYFFTQQISGDLVDVQNITPSTVEPHEYELTPKDMMSIEKSTLFIVIGNNFEAWGNRVQEITHDSKTKVLVLGDEMKSTRINNELDPHIWLSPKLTEQIVQKITSALSLSEPKQSKIFHQNANTLIQKLKVLDSEYEIGLASCKKKDFITSHSAFVYLAHDYGLNQISISGISPEAEPSPKQLIQITQFAKDNDIDVIFFEKLVSPKYSETIAKETGAKAMILDPIEGISDTDQQNGRDYFSLMRENLNNLKIALHCNP